MNTSFSRGLSTVAIIVLAALVVAALYVGGTYNALVRGSQGVDAQWAQVESQYQRRFDLVPNLVEAVKGTMKQEQAVFGAIADARTHYASAATTDAKVAAASQYDSAISRLLVVMENYPQLKSADNVQSLMAEVAGTENRIATERMRFNETVRDYNVSVQTFPGSFVARMFGFSARTMFASQAGAESAPKVQF